ncbi:expressed conserved protein [Echinococcus multilocularis]|uniref:Expressed conserved protein n=1 Tax=Echinococcus multilocularis TaxID=6211 RepID=A0A068YJ43_ECHMU|nr:expressed conserved protein [Echinococcus multilocularis]
MANQFSRPDPWNQYTRVRWFASCIRVFLHDFIHCRLKMIGYVCTFLILLVTIIGTELNEKHIDGPTFQVVRNPGCNNDTGCPKNETKLIQIIARHPNATFHFLLPGSHPDAPLSIVMLETNTRPSELQVNWTQFLARNGSISNSIFLNGTHTSYGVILYEFCTYSDINDDARLTPTDVQSQCHHLLGKNLLWTLTDNAVGKNPPNFVYTATNSTDSLDGLGKIVVNISFPREKSEFAQRGVLSLEPGNGMLFDITIDSVRAPEQGRVAMILLPFSHDPLQMEEDFVESLSLSENRRETLFNLHLGQRQLLQEYGKPDMQVVAPRVFGHTPAFMQWTTTCEVSMDGVAKRSATAGPRMQIPSKTQSKYRYSLPLAVYGDAFSQKHNPDQVNRSVGVRLQAVSFGSPHDGFYVATNFVRWRGILSMGEPKEPSDEKFGSLIAVGIALSLMLLAMISVTAGILMYRRHKAAGREGENEPLLPPDGNNITRSVIPLPHFSGRLCLFRRIPSPQLSRCDEEPDINI